MSFPAYDRETLLQFALKTLRNRLKVNPTPGTFWYKLADSWADVLVSQSGHQQHITKQILPDTAEGDALERHARLRGIERKSSRHAQGKVNIRVVEE